MAVQEMGRDEMQTAVTPNNNNNNTNYNIHEYKEVMLCFWPQ